MKKLINVLAVIGIIMIVGAVGKMDYMVTLEQDYSVCRTAALMCIGFVFTIPAILRAVK